MVAQIIISHRLVDSFEVGDRTIRHTTEHDVQGQIPPTGIASATGAQRLRANYVGTHDAGQRVLAQLANIPTHW